MDKMTEFEIGRLNKYKFKCVLNATCILLTCIHAKHSLPSGLHRYIVTENVFCSVSISSIQ